MCKLTELQHNIQSITKDGYDIAALPRRHHERQTPGVKVCHRMEAAKHLIKYGFPDADCETTSDRLSRAGGNPKGQGGDETPSKVPSPRGRGLGSCRRGEKRLQPP